MRGALVLEGKMSDRNGCTPNSEELLRLLIESATDFAIFSTDAAGLVTTWNSGAERVLGYAEAEILGRTADCIFVPEDRRAGAAEEERRQASAYGKAEDERWSMRKGRGSGRLAF
jgi:PAS domain S-box-containing protein